MPVKYYKSSGNKIKLVLDGKNKFYLIAHLLIILLMMISLGFAAAKIETFTIVLGIALVPILVCLFIIKLLVWNLWGTESIDIQSDQLIVNHDYKFIYKPWRESYQFENPQFFARSASSGKINQQEVSELNEKDSLKLIIQANENNEFTSSFTIPSSKLKELFQDLEKHKAFRQKING